MLVMDGARLRTLRMRYALRCRHPCLECLLQSRHPQTIPKQVWKEGVLGGKPAYVEHLR